MKFKSLLSPAILAWFIVSSSGCSEQGGQMTNIPDVNEVETATDATNANSSSLNIESMPKSNDAKTGNTSMAKWLETVRGKTLKIPVVIKAGAFGIDSAVLCSSIDAESTGQPLRLDDSALGISLKDSIRDLADARTGKCFVWLQGKSGTLLSPSSADDVAPIEATKPHDFTVYKFLGSVEESPANPSLSP